MRVLITGATGYLGTAMLEAVPQGIEAIPVGFSRGALTLDITDRSAVESALAHHLPDVVVHLAAVSEVAKAGDDPGGASAVNFVGARNVAAEASAGGLRLISLSSDVVFDGGAPPYSEAAAPQPINDYGRSKLAGERAVAAEHPSALIVRTSVLVGRDRADRHPFSAFVLERAEAEKPIELYENERRNFYPVTSAAEAVWECATGELEGLLHIGGAESLSRYEFGQRLLERAGHNPTLAVATTGPADRPSDLTLDLSLAERVLRTPMPAAAEVIDIVIADAEPSAT